MIGSSVKGSRMGPVRAQAGAVEGTVKAVAIKDLVRSEAFQVRAGLYDETVTRYANVIKAWADERHPADSTAPLPPITVAILNGAPVVVDGWHRVAAHEALGIREIEARILTGLSEHEARWRAAAANMQHGLPLTKRELRKAFKAFIKAGQHKIMDPQGRPYAHRYKSYAQITKDFGGLAGRTTIQRWVQLDFPALAVRMSKEGTQRPEAGPPDEPGKAFLDRALEALQEAVANGRGISDEAARGLLIAGAEQALASLRNQGPWEPSEF